jgi:O-antigen/teichoic acid export membrane protein
MSDSSSTAPAAVAPARPGGALARNAFFLLLGQIASTALSIAFSAALGRNLGAADFGVYFILVSMSTFAYVVVDWGQSAYLIREAARRPEAEDTLLGSALVFRSVGAAGVAVLTLLTASLLGYDARTQGLAGLTVVCALPLALSQPYGFLFRGRDRMDLDAIVTVSAKAITVGLAVPALILGGQLLSVVVVQGLGGAGALLVAILLARRIGLPSPRPSRATIRELLAGGAPIAMFFVAISVQPYIDAIVLSKLTPPPVVGWYGAARNIMGVLFAPASILATAAFPELSRAAADIPTLRRAIRRSLRPLLGLGALGAVGTYLFAGFAVTLIYGRGRFDPAIQVLQLFAPALLLFFIDILLGTVITAVGRTRELAAVKILSVAVSTGLALVMVPFFQTRFGNGGMGLVLAFGSTEVMMLAAYVWLAPPGAFEAAALLDLGRAVASGAATLALFSWLPPMAPWFALPASVVVFAGLALATGLVRWSEISSRLASLRS